MFELCHHILLQWLLLRDRQLRGAPATAGHLQGPASRTRTIFRPARSYRPSSASPCRGVTRKEISPRSGSDASSRTTSPLMATPAPPAGVPAAITTRSPSLTPSDTTEPPPR